MLLLMDPAAFVMTRRMLLGIEQRAEALARDWEGSPPIGKRASADGPALRAAASWPMDSVGGERCLESMMPSP